MQTQVPVIHVRNFILVLEKLYKHFSADLAKTSPDYHFDKTKLHGDCLEFWTCRQSLLSYIVSIGGFGWKEVEAPSALSKYCSSLLNLYLKAFPEDDEFTFYTLKTLHHSPRVA